MRMKGKYKKEKAVAKTVFSFYLIQHEQSITEHLTRIHNEFSSKLRILQQSVERTQRTTIFFSRALYTPIRPFRGIALLFFCILHPKNGVKLLRDCLYIWRTHAFDSAFYMRVYPDVTACAFNPIMHYCRYGWKEKRNPSSKFNTAIYLTQNPDVAACGINPFYHYLRYGSREEWRKNTMTTSQTGMECTSCTSAELRRIPTQLNPEKILPETLDKIIDNVRKELYDVLQ